MARATTRVKGLARNSVSVATSVFVAVLMAGSLQSCNCNSASEYRRHSGTDDDSVGEVLAPEVERYAELLIRSNEMTELIISGHLKEFHEQWSSDALKEKAALADLVDLYNRVEAEVGRAESYRADQWKFQVRRDATKSFVASIKVVKHERGSMYYTFVFSDEHAVKISAFRFSRRG